jgi:hypothetical protein
VRAREQLQQPQNKLLHLTVFQLRSVLRAVLLLPFTLPAAAAARWQALFASQSYEHFLLSEGERVWAFRNRTENERWFWEVFAMDRCDVQLHHICQGHGLFSSSNLPAVRATVCNHYDGSSSVCVIALACRGARLTAKCSDRTSCCFFPDTRCICCANGCMLQILCAHCVGHLLPDGGA